MVDMIGYPEFIVNQSRLDDYYADLEVTNETYFNNVVNASQFQVRKMFQRLRRPVDKKRWEMTPPQVRSCGRQFTVNATAGEVVKLSISV